MIVGATPLRRFARTLAEPEPRRLGVRAAPPMIGLCTSSAFGEDVGGESPYLKWKGKMMLPVTRTLNSGKRVLPQEMGAAKVWNRRTEDFPRDGAQIGRPSKWGNPFKSPRDGTPEEVVARYRLWFTAQPKLVAEAKLELAGRDLVCWCAPDHCHGDVLFEVANEPAVGEVAE